MKVALLSMPILFSLLLGCTQEGTNEIDLSGVIDQIEFSNLTEQQEYNIEFNFETNRQLDATNASAVEKNSTDGLHEFGNSHLYHIFPGQNTIIETRVETQDPNFPAMITIHIFEMTLPEGSLEDWVNYQHSNAPLPEPLPPIQSITLNTDQYFIQSSFFIEHIVGDLGDEYDRYRVEYYIDDHYLPGAFNLINFTSTLDVYLRTKDIPD